MGKDFWKTNKNNWRSRRKTNWYFQDLKPKAITYKSDDDNASIGKEIYKEILEGKMDEILEIRIEINYSNLVYDFKGTTHSISFS